MRQIIYQGRKHLSIELLGSLEHRNPGVMPDIKVGQRKDEDIFVGPVG